MFTYETIRLICAFVRSEAAAVKGLDWVEGDSVLSGRFLQGRVNTLWTKESFWSTAIYRCSFRTPVGDDRVGSLVLQRFSQPSKSIICVRIVRLMKLVFGRAQVFLWIWVHLNWFIALVSLRRRRRRETRRIETLLSYTDLYTSLYLGGGRWLDLGHGRKEGPSCNRHPYTFPLLTMFLVLLSTNEINYRE